MEQEQINIEDIMQEIRAEIRAKGYEDNEIPFSDIACLVGRSEERRVGKECRSRWSPYH